MTMILRWSLDIVQIYDHKQSINRFESKMPILMYIIICFVSFCLSLLLGKATTIFLTFPVKQIQMQMTMLNPLASVQQFLINAEKCLLGVICNAMLPSVVFLRIHSFNGKLNVRKGDTSSNRMRWPPLLRQLLTLYPYHGNKIESLWHRGPTKTYWYLQDTSIVRVYFVIEYNQYMLISSMINKWSIQS